MLFLLLLACRGADPAPPPRGAPASELAAPAPATTAASPNGPAAPTVVGEHLFGLQPKDEDLPEEDRPDRPEPEFVPVDGPCKRTVIAEIGPRLAGGGGTPDLESGVTVRFRSGLVLVDYSRPKIVESQKPGDKVEVCLVEVPIHCPPGDDRGKRYRVRDLRLGQSYTMSDAMHVCGGA